MSFLALDELPCTFHNHHVLDIPYERMGNSDFSLETPFKVEPFPKLG